MMSETIMPFGPQHPLLPEPLLLKLVMQDEKIIDAIPAIGYMHRGLEKLAERKEFTENIHVVERICGKCSFMHTLAYCQGIEKMMDLRAPDRARYLRVIWSELSRMHDHLLWLGLLADILGFESSFLQFCRDREKIMEINKETAGNRIIISVNTIGGTVKGIEKDLLVKILVVLDEVMEDLQRLEPKFLNNCAVQQRLAGIGILGRDKAYALGAVGPAARASGICQDLRTAGYAAYGELDFEPVMERDGDCYARTIIRFKEIYQSIDLIRQAIGIIPGGEVAVDFDGNPDGEVISRIEQSGGEMLYYIKANGSKNLDRLRIRTSSFANMPALFQMLPGCHLDDIPVIMASTGLCMACAER